MRTVSDGERAWIDMAVASGRPFVDFDGNRQQPRTPAEQEAARARVAAERNAGEEGKLPPVVTIVPTHPTTKITVTCIDGKLTHLSPVILWGSSDERAWYEQEIQRLKAELAICQDKSEMEDLTAQIREYRFKQLEAFIPDLPPNLLTRLDPTQVDTIWAVIRRMEWDAQQVMIEVQKKILAPRQLEEMQAEYARLLRSATR